MTLAVITVVVLVAVAVLAAGGALDRPRRAVTRRRVVVREPAVTERVVGRVVDRPHGRW